ncbi:Serine/threonine-protein kinase DCLK3 [Porphyridium purpureum]|uniref:Serine/threonine-protein kinase DCLK3 n=1 Tax=Porphyridium purpureum TaxID=35688 RepID=A0A5J4YK58_PORPP|nr:Serine/threonine-protein kinase DCLK3 [Porphyridium purpureum]|eukprot:POR0868..scf251_18
MWARNECQLKKGKASNVGAVSWLPGFLSSCAASGFSCRVDEVQWVYIVLGLYLRRCCCKWDTSKQRVKVAVKLACVRAPSGRRACSCLTCDKQCARAVPVRTWTAARERMAAVSGGLPMRPSASEDAVVARGANVGFRRSSSANMGAAGYGLLHAQQDAAQAPVIPMERSLTASYGDNNIGNEEMAGAQGFFELETGVARSLDTSVHQRLRSPNKVRSPDTSHRQMSSRSSSRRHSVTRVGNTPDVASSECVARLSTSGGQQTLAMSTGSRQNSNVRPAGRAFSLFRQSAPGARFKDAYQLEQCLSAGVYGSVYTARPLNSYSFFPHASSNGAGSGGGVAYELELKETAKLASAPPTASSRATAHSDLVVVKTWQGVPVEEVIVRAVMGNSKGLNSDMAPTRSSRKDNVLLSNSIDLSTLGSEKQAIVSEMECMLREAEVARKKLTHRNIVEYLEYFVSCDECSPDLPRLVHYSSSQDSQLERYVASWSKDATPSTPDVVHTQDTYSAEASGSLHPVRERMLTPSVFLVMEYLQGPNLRSALVRRQSPGSLAPVRIPEETVMGIMLQLFEGLLFLSANGIIHRDIKPENLMLEADVDLDDIAASLPTLKIIDFNMSYLFPERFPWRKRYTSGAYGTPEYTSPEILCSENYGFKVDTWSAGVIMAELLVGELPFQGRTHLETMKQVLSGELDFESGEWVYVSASAKDLVSQLLLRDPGRRPSARAALKHRFFSAARSHSVLKRATRGTSQDDHGFSSSNPITPRLLGLSGLLVGNFNDEQPNSPSGHVLGDMESGKPSLVHERSASGGLRAGGSMREQLKKLGSIGKASTKEDDGSSTPADARTSRGVSFSMSHRTGSSILGRALSGVARRLRKSKSGPEPFLQAVRKPTENLFEGRGEIAPSLDARSSLVLFAEPKEPEHEMSKDEEPQ